MNNEKSEYFEIQFDLLFTITNDILQHAINANIDMKALNNLTVRIPTNSEDAKRFYEIGV